MAVNKRMGYTYINDKCNPPKVDMGVATVFADAMPGVNNTTNRPFGWTEYEAEFRHKYIPACPERRICIDPCKPRGRRPPPRQFANAGHYPRSTICQLCNNAKCCCEIPPPWEECREKVMVYDPDSVRTLYVHGEVKNEHPFVLSNDDYYRIMNDAIVKDKDQLRADCEREIQEKECELARCREKADDMRLMDENRLMDCLSPEAREESNEILSRADCMLKEDEPEVRTLNKVILGAKVQAIREAQLHEKALIRCEEAEENRRLDAYMLQESGFGKDDETEFEDAEQKKRDLMASLKAQMDEHEALKFYFKEMAEREGCEMRKIWEQFDLEEIRRKQLENEKRSKLGIELIQNQMLTIERMRQEKEIDKALDQMMLDYARIKEANEARLEHDRNIAAKMKALAMQQVLETQRRTTDSKEMMLELRARRHQEEQEREWRRREKCDMLKKQQAAQDLKCGLVNQIQAKQCWIIEQAAYDKAMYDKLFNIQDNRLEEEAQAAEEKRIRDTQYKFELKEQLHRFQVDKIRERKEYFIEGVKCRQRLAAKDHELRCLMGRKVEELRGSCMPEKYLKYIERAVEEELKPEWQKKISK